MTQLFLRPDGDNWSPLHLPGLIGWWSADTGVSTSGGNVTSVTDQSGNGKTLTPVSGDVPFDATGLDGAFPAFDFLVANTAGLENTSFTGLGTGTTGSCFIVGQLLAATGTTGGGGVSFLGNSGQSDWNSAGSAAWIVGNVDASNFIETHRSGLAAVFTAISLATTYRIGAIFDGANLTIYIDNVAGTPTAFTSAWANTASYLAIGGRISGGVFNGAGAWEGPISQIVITSGALDTTNRALLDAYSVDKWS